MEQVEKNTITCNNVNKEEAAAPKLPEKKIIFKYEHDRGPTSLRIILGADETKTELS